MTKVHGKRYAYKFDFQGLAAATQPAASDPAYKYQSDLFMAPYHHGTKITTFMSPHHGMTSSSGEQIKKIFRFFLLFRFIFFDFYLFRYFLLLKIRTNHWISTCVFIYACIN